MRYFFIVFISFFILAGFGQNKKIANIKEQPAGNKQEKAGETPSAESEAIPDSADFINVGKYPEQIYEEVPEFPERGLNANINAKIIIEAYIDETGKVLKAHALKCTSPGYGFEEASTTAAYKCTYKPARKNGKPIGCWISYVVHFIGDPNKPSATLNFEHLSNMPTHQNVVPSTNWPPPPDSIPVDELPQPFQLVKPEYPQSASPDKPDATVTLAVYISSLGHVKKIEIITSDNPSNSFSDNASEAAKKTQFSPAKRNGIKIGTWVYYDVIFNKLSGVSVGEIKQLFSNTKEELTASKDGIISPDEFVAVDVVPEQIYEEIPEYPSKALEKKITGFVIVEVFVDENGNVKKGQVKSCQPKNWGFEQAATNSAYKCKYKPALRDGKPVGVWI
ncbi:MAG: energy transducer TonB [Candidatus Zixiibacteriota bacterium]